VEVIRLAPTITTIEADSFSGNFDSSLQLYIPPEVYNSLPGDVREGLVDFYVGVEVSGNLGDGALTLGGQLVYEITGSGEAVKYTGSDTVIVYAGDESGTPEELGQTALTSGGFSITINKKPVTLYPLSTAMPDHIFGNWQSLTADPADTTVAEVYLRTLTSSKQVVKSEASESGTYEPGPPDNFKAEYNYVQYLYVDKDVTITLTGEEQSGTFYGASGTRWSNDTTLKLTKGWNALYTIHDVASTTAGSTEEISISVENPHFVWIISN
jgi:hypothetical protein